jgi:hypothetical protein
METKPVGAGPGAAPFDLVAPPSCACVCAEAAEAAWRLASVCKNGSVASPIRAASNRACTDFASTPDVCDEAEAGEVDAAGETEGEVELAADGALFELHSAAASGEAKY